MLGSPLPSGIGWMPSLASAGVRSRPRYSVPRALRLLLGRSGSALALSLLPCGVAARRLGWELSTANTIRSSVAQTYGSLFAKPVLASQPNLVRPIATRDALYIEPDAAINSIFITAISCREMRQIG